MKVIAFAAVLASMAATAHAGPIAYSVAAVLNPQTVTLADVALGLNEQASAGRIDLSTPGGVVSGFCIDVAHALLPSGTFADGGALGGAFGATVNALLSHVGPTLAGSPDASAALQVAIWRAEYGSELTVIAPAAVDGLAGQYLATVTEGAWRADPGQQVAVLSGGGANQDQAYLVEVPEPQSLAVLCVGLVASGLARRRAAVAPRGQILDIIA